MKPVIRNPSPFRYPGSKHALTEYVIRFLAANGITRPHFYEPFAGGASLSLGLLERDAIATATWVEKDPLVYAFWKCVRRSPAELCDRIWRLKITMRTWEDFQKFRDPDAYERFALMDLAVAGLFFNRTNFSGVIGAKPIGGMSQSSAYPIDCRWNAESLVERICAIAAYGSRIRVNCGDAVAYLKRQHASILDQQRERRALVYLDPPYYVQGAKLYRHHFLEQDHERLADYLNRCGLPWLVSYDDHERIRALFSGPNRRVLPINLQYTVRSNRRANELLITNLAELPEAIMPAPIDRDEAKALRMYM